MFEVEQPTNEQLDATPVMLLAPPRHPNFDTHEGRLFRNALALIENPLRWTKNIRENEERTRYCALGAIGKQYKDDPWFYPGNPIMDSVVNALARTIGSIDTPHGYTVSYSSEAGTNQAVLACHNNNRTHDEHIAIWRACGKENGWL